MARFIEYCRQPDGASGYIRNLGDLLLLLVGREYIEPRRQPDGASGYFVYRADMNGSDAVPTIWDGQDRETIEAVERDCSPEGFISYRD